MLTIRATKSRPRPAIYHGTEWIRDCDNLSRDVAQIRAANVVLERHQKRQDRINAARRALALCGQLTHSRARWTRRTMIALNKARSLDLG